MGYVVVQVNPDGTAAVTATSPDDRDTAAAWAAANGGEVVTRATVDAIHAAAVGAPPAGIPTPEFRRRLLPVRLRLAGLTAEKREAWANVLGELDHFPAVVVPADIAPLVQAAQADGLLSADEAAALTAAP